ncbi:MAG: chemotaxis protein CheX [Desulfobacteraceae bacterium]|nr:chemotaxis protein CheX [Desulfobacteraceae bacterium]
MKKILMAAMMTSISEVMETMFFLPIEFGEDESIAKLVKIISKPIACQLSFTGDAAGRLIFVAPKELTAEMAENFMGEPQDQLTDEHLFGTLTEMLNMVCGNALSKTKSKVPYSLGLPEMVTASQIDTNELFTVVETTESKMAIAVILDE